MVTDKIYRKVGRKYVPIGACEPVNYLPNGIWLVHGDRRAQGRTSMLWLHELYRGFTKLGDEPVADFTKIAKMELYTDAIANVLHKYNGQMPLRNKCYQDIAREVVNEMFNVNEKNK